MLVRQAIFDLGDVIIPLHFDRMVAAFAKLGMPQFDLFYQKHKTDIFDAFELGKLNPSQFRQTLRSYFEGAKKASDEQLDVAWNMWLGDLPRERLEAIKNLKAEGCRTFLFSNTNELHLREIYRRYGRAVFAGCFEAECYSFRLRQKKPDPAAFASILARQGLEAKHTMHIDDTLEHLQGARSAGLQVLQVWPLPAQAADISPVISPVVPSLFDAIKFVKSHNQLCQKNSPAQPAAAAKKQETSWSLFSWCSCFSGGRKEQKLRNLVSLADEVNLLGIKLN